jgi:hypothetical protein
MDLEMAFILLDSANLHLNNLMLPDQPPNNNRGKTSINLENISLGMRSLPFIPEHLESSAGASRRSSGSPHSRASSHQQEVCNVEL